MTAIGYSRMTDRLLKIGICVIFPLTLGNYPARSESAVEIRVGSGASVQKQSLVPGQGVTFRDCAQCPDLVLVPATTQPVRLGAPEGEEGRISNEVVHQRTLKSFAIGRTEVSVAEYQQCVAARACPEPEWREPGGTQNIETGTGRYYKNLGATVTGPDYPIVGVSYNDANAYVAWLSELTGHRYRLPSEAEWEYAARAGTSTAFWWGSTPNDQDGKARGNCRGCGTADRPLTADPVTSFSANPWGLFNVHGNVWEWVADFYCIDQSTGPDGGGPRTADDCPERDAAGLRVLRGGSAFYEADKMRSASRLRNFPGFRNFSVGFRVARDP